MFVFCCLETKSTIKMDLEWSFQLKTLPVKLFYDDWSACALGAIRKTQVVRIPDLILFHFKMYLWQGQMPFVPFLLLGQDLFFFWGATSGLENHFTGISSINHLFFQNINIFFFVHKYLDCLLAILPCCTVADHGWCLFHTWLLGTQLKMTWEGLTLKGQALGFAWNSCVLSDWSVAFIVASDRS